MATGGWPVRGYEEDDQLAYPSFSGWLYVHQVHQVGIARSKIRNPKVIWEEATSHSLYRLRYCTAPLNPKLPLHMGELDPQIIYGSTQLTTRNGILVE